MTENQYQRANRMVLITILIVWVYCSNSLSGIRSFKGRTGRQDYNTVYHSVGCYDCINRSIHNEKENTYM